VEGRRFRVARGRRPWLHRGRPQTDRRGTSPRSEPLTHQPRIESWL